MSKKSLLIAFVLPLFAFACVTLAKSTKMKLADAPEPVQKTIKANTLGAAITDLEKQEKNGVVVYEADYKVAGKEYEIRVAPDGRLLSNKEDDDDDGPDDDDDGPDDDGDDDLGA
ncbi:MAG TPA: hypothetical protein VGP99_07935 [Tepidisphaeraceae bacterium]|jgi:hypothetical protein|nr:hypothetical protein [Tepidisphaeraceae bacterium]